jgi:hypothetical protein
MNYRLFAVAKVNKFFGYPKFYTLNIAFFVQLLRQGRETEVPNDVNYLQHIPLTEE